MGDEGANRLEQDGSERNDFDEDWMFYTFMWIRASV